MTSSHQIYINNVYILIKMFAKIAAFQIIAYGAFAQTDQDKERFPEFTNVAD